MLKITQLIHGETQTSTDGPRAWWGTLPDLEAKAPVLPLTAL